MIEIWAEHSEYGEPRFMGEAASWDEALEKIKAWPSSDDYDEDDPASESAWPAGWDAYGFDRERRELAWLEGEMHGSDWIDAWVDSDRQDAWPDRP